MSNELQYYAFVKKQQESKEEKECNCDCSNCDKKDTDECCKKKGKCGGCSKPCVKD